ncbi:unnamed protein product [Ilex paraguariensis]|uniref:Uncharacterized protein n=1 Tax=Ilex paraguariensis TaxID=185542 RepID=A0ABC8R5N9_9AQUA
MDISNPRNNGDTLGADCARETLVLDPPCVREKEVTNARKKSYLEKKKRRKNGGYTCSQSGFEPAFHPPVQSPGMPLHVNFHIQDSSNKIAENDMSMKLPDLSHGGQDI